MTEKTLTTENIKPAIDALRGELAPWPVVAMKQDKLNDTQKSAVNSGITSGLVAQIIANTAAIRALESAITGTGLRPLVVASLPAIGTQGILYIVPVTTYDPATDADVVNYSNEYIWIVAPDAPVTEGYYEQVGQTGIVINNGQLNITVNGTSVGTFTANQAGDTTAAITVPTNADYVDRTTAQSAAGVKTFSDGIVSNVTGNVTGDLTGTASRAIADEDGTNIKTGYVNVAGTQTITGNKDWTGTNRFNLSLYQKGFSTRASAPASNEFGQLAATDTNNAPLMSLNYANRTTGERDFTFRVYDSAGNVNGAGVYKDAVNNYSFCSIDPNNPISLGTSTNQWSSVYAQTYYYNGTQWGLDKANVWSSLNVFQKGIYLAGDRQAYVCPMWDGAQSGLALLTQNKQVFIGNYTDDASSRKVLDTTKGNIRIFAGESNNETAAIIDPVNAVNSQLGTSTNKWLTINGVNPGALSLPSSNYIEIDTTNWDLTGADNSYTPPADGYIFCGSSTGTDVKIFDFTTMLGSTSHSSTVKPNYVYLPVRKNDNCIVGFIGSAPPSARFYPCLGNV